MTEASNDLLAGLERINSDDDVQEAARNLKVLENDLLIACKQAEANEGDTTGILRIASQVNMCVHHLDGDGCSGIRAALRRIHLRRLRSSRRDAGP